jgi:NADH:ubiquinone oxidoreductase subunit 4 (subunit M)
LCLLGIVYSSLVTIRQVDLKKVIAYSSVAHMNFALLGLFTNQMEGLEGCLYYMLGHGLVSSALFFSIGMLYDRYHTRTILYYGGLIQTMPIFGLFFLILTFSNMGFPGTVNFIGEFLVSIGV